MRTYPHHRADGSIAYFEVSNAFPWSLGPMRRVLQSVTGVSDYRRNWRNEHRFSFTYHDRKCVVWEPWGDNSRYWIGPEAMEPPFDMSPIDEAFRRFRFRFTLHKDFWA
jgi:hypothetical protein